MRRSSRPVAACAVAATVLATATGARALGDLSSARSLYAGGSPVATLAVRALDLHASPGSPHTVARVADTTEFGTPTHLAVVAAGAGWLGVLSPELANGVVGYVRTTDVRVAHDPYAIEVDLSRHRLTVWKNGRRTHTIRVGIGQPPSVTPSGRFSITDKLRDFMPSVYGCCILALSGHQGNLPAGWTGGDRLAIHAGSGVGAAVSAGCLHASDADLRYLLARLPLGTQVVIHP